MKFTTKQRKFLIAPSLSHLFVYSHRTASQHKAAQPVSMHGLKTVQQCQFHTNPTVSTGVVREGFKKKLL